jgi:hypothetical protein
MNTANPDAAITEEDKDAAVNVAVETPEVETPERALDADGLPEEFTLEDLEALPEDERDAIIADQQAITDAAAAEEASVKQAKADEDAAAIEAAQPAPVAKQEQIPDTTKAQQELTAAEAAKKAVMDEYKAGDIDDEEFTTRLMDVDKTIVNSRVVIESANAMRQQSQNAIADQWYGKLDNFHAINPALQTAEHNAGWDAELRAVNTQFPRRDMDQNIKLAYERYKITADAMGIPLTGAAPVIPPVDPDEGKLKVSTEPRPGAPTTLKTAPAADLNSPNDSRFGAIDKAVTNVTNTQELYSAEAAMASMSEAERDAYLRD